MKEYIKKIMRKRLGLDENDTSQDKTILKYSPYKIVDEYLMWQGIIGYTDDIINIVKNAYNIK